jgi:hypothetical protein
MSEFYYYVWGLYAVGAVGLLYLGWLLLRHIKLRVFGLALMALLVALLLTPARMIPGQEDLTPALMITLLDGLSGGWSGAWNGLKYILLVYIALLALLVLGYSIRMVFRPKKIKNNAAEKEVEAE